MKAEKKKKRSKGKMGQIEIKWQDNRLPIIISNINDLNHS